MSSTLILNQSQVSVGLPTYTYTVPAAGIYSVLLDVTANPASSLSVLVKNNGFTVFTAPSFSVTQGAMQFKYTQLFAATDVMTVVLSSAAAVDNLLNSVKAICSIQQGE